MLSAVLLATALVTPTTTPVTLLSGFLGAGKTTSLKHLLSNAEGMRYGVVVNDVAKLNIDAALISNAVASSESDSDVVRLQNGCACCSLSGELNTALQSLSASGEYDHLIVELSGVANPDTAKANLNKALAADSTLGVALDRVVTLVDSSTFLSYFERDVQVAETPALRELSADDDAPIDKCADRKAVPQLLVNQVEGADVLVMNKLDLITPNEQRLVEKLLCAFNTRGKVVATQFGKLPADIFVSPTRPQTASTTSELDQMNDDAKLAAAKPSLPKKKTSNKLAVQPKWSRPPADPVIEALGIQSFVYSARRPFDTRRLFLLLQQWPRDGASPLQRVSLDLGLGVAAMMAGVSDEKLADLAQQQLAANPDKPALRFTLGDRVECAMGYWAAGKITHLWYAEPGMEAAAPYQVLLDECASPALEPRSLRACAPCSDHALMRLPCSDDGSVLTTALRHAVCGAVAATSFARQTTIRWCGVRSARCRLAPSAACCGARDGVGSPTSRRGPVVPHLWIPILSGQA